MPKLEHHTDLPESAGYVIAIVVGILLIIFAFSKILDSGMATLVGVVGILLIVVGFLKLLSS